jgi:hypothetical protein
VRAHREFCGVVVHVTVPGLLAGRAVVDRSLWSGTSRTFEPGAPVDGHPGGHRRVVSGVDALADAGLPVATRRGEGEVHHLDALGHTVTPQPAA